MASPAPLGPGDGTSAFTAGDDEGVYVWQDAAARAAAGPGQRVRCRPPDGRDGARRGAVHRGDTGRLSRAPTWSPPTATCCASPPTSAPGGTGSTWRCRPAPTWWSRRRWAATVPQLRRLGPGAAPVASNAWVLPTSGLPVLPRPARGANLGVAFRRPGPRVASACGSTATGPPTGSGRIWSAFPAASRVTGVDVDPDDALTAGPRAASLTRNVGAWWDGFDAGSRPAPPWRCTSTSRARSSSTC